MRARLFLSATILAASLVLGPTAEARRDATPEPPKVAEPVGTWTSGKQPERDCSRARRKFWLPEEGWIVRSVLSCR
ncbi:hypothetical protein [Methylobacterium sp. J-077]|uniref:hypothetical protein n=1 Tax=Methylobacterium sp. J-077 TaxID=2836656 RepID=UPI001FB89717|nr:hypothetical protein [Methylobacterium sp. J-077]MCJ2124693.1 hypothetical protein [Methylobacterium sp. J-077]